MLRKKRFLSVLLSVLLVLGSIPVTAMAETTESEENGLCEHHPQHTDECGYIEAQEEIPCNMGCADMDGDGTVDHAEGCTYQPAVEGQPCTYVCEICNPQDSGEEEAAGMEEEPATPGRAINSAVTDVQALIDALPTAEELESMGLDEQAAAYEQVQAAYDAYNALTDEQKEQITGADIFDPLFAFFTEPSVMADGIHTCEGVADAVALTAAGGLLDGGNYYLPGDITLTDDLTISGNVTLCLNGHVLRGSGTGSVITVNEGATFTLCDCGTNTTTIGENTYNGGVITGGTGNTGSTNSENHGGGVYVSGDATFIMNGGNIAENNTGFGGGVYVNGTFTMNQGNIVGNQTNSLEGGAGVYIDDGAKFTMEDGAIADNTASHYGGGVGSDYYGEATFVMEGGTISGNNACYGGGVNLDGTFTMKGGAITKNTAARETLGYGAGVYMGTGTFTMEGGEITDNTAYYTSTIDFAAAYGGGVFLTGATVFNMKGGTIANNTATTRGNGVYVDYAAFYMTGGYLGENSIYVSPDIVEYTKFSGGYFADKKMAETYLKTGYTVEDISADNNHYGDTDYQSGYPYAVYQAGTTNYGVSNVTTTYGTSFTPTVTGNDHNATVSFTYVDSNNSPVTGTPSAVGKYTGTASFAPTLVVEEVETEIIKTFYPSVTKTFAVEITKANQTAPSAPTQSGTATTNSFTIRTVSGQKYICTTDSSTPDNSTGIWIDGTGNDHTFSNLDAGTTYYIWTYLPETTTENASDVSNALSVTTLPSISTKELDTGYVGVAYEEKLAATVASGKTVTWELASASTLPAGLTLNSDGTIAGTPKTTASSHSFTVRATIEGADSTERISNTATMSITINAGTPVITANTYNGEAQTDTFNYGDTITVRGTISASATAPGTSTNAITQNQVGLYLGETELATADVDSNGNFTLSYDTAGQGISIGEDQTLTVRYGGSSALTNGETTVTVTLNKRPVTVTFTGSTTKVYDGNTNPPKGLAIAPSDGIVVADDDVTVTADSIAYNSANVSEANTITASGIALSGSDADWYTLSSTEATTSGSITAADIDGTVSISGMPVCGYVLTASYIPVHMEQVTYQWSRNNEDIDGATGENYTLTVADVGAAITVRAIAGDENHTGYVTSNPTIAIGPTYTVTIPEKVDLGGTVTISASGVNVASGQQLEVAITGTSGDNDAFTLTNQEGAEITYTVTAGNDLVRLNSTVLTVNGGKANANGETSLTFVKPDEEEIPFSGTYTGTMTFTIRTREVSGS